MRAPLLALMLRMGSDPALRGLGLLGERLLPPQFTDALLKIESGDGQIVVDPDAKDRGVAPVSVEPVIEHGRERGKSAALVEVSILVEFHIHDLLGDAVVLVD